VEAAAAGPRSPVSRCAARARHKSPCERGIFVLFLFFFSSSSSRWRAAAAAAAVRVSGSRSQVKMLGCEKNAKHSERVAPILRCARHHPPPSLGCLLSADETRAPRRRQAAGQPPSRTWKIFLWTEEEENPAVLVCVCVCVCGGGGVSLYIGPSFSSPPKMKNSQSKI